MTEQKTYTAGQKVGAGKYVCMDCGKELTLDKSEQDLRKCPSCACEEYQCFPMTHIRPDIKTPEDAKNPPKRGKKQPVTFIFLFMDCTAYVTPGSSCNKIAQGFLLPGIN